MQHNCPKVGKTTAKGATPLQTPKPQLSESLVRQTWLQYFNDYLRERHIIAEEEWRKMRYLIQKG